MFARFGEKIVGDAGNFRPLRAVPRLFLPAFPERRPLRNFRRIWDDRPADTGCCRREMICVARAKAVFLLLKINTPTPVLIVWSFCFSRFRSFRLFYFPRLHFLFCALSRPFFSVSFFPLFPFFLLFLCLFPVFLFFSSFLCFFFFSLFFFPFFSFFLFPLFLPFFSFLPRTFGCSRFLTLSPFSPRSFLKFLLSCSFFFSFRDFIFTFSFVAFHLSPSRPFWDVLFSCSLSFSSAVFCVLFFLSPFVPPLNSRILLFSLSDLSCLAFFCSFSFGLFLFSPLFLASAFFPFFLPFFEVWRGG